MNTKVNANMFARKLRSIENQSSVRLNQQGEIPFLNRKEHSSEYLINLEQQQARHLFPLPKSLLDEH
jgi:hypothetical protein